MATPAEIVTAFLAECGKSKAAMEAAFRQYFASNGIWENIGFSKTNSLEEAIALMAQFETSAGIACFGVENLAIAENGNKVLTERVDTMLDSTGKALKELQVMGVFEVADGKIVKWRDYFDTAGFAAG